jgi:anti-anti-sigma factor
LKSDLSIDIEQKEKYALLNLKGELTLFAEETVNEAMAVCMGKSQNIVMNFADVEYINSAGIAVIIGVITELTKKGGTLKLVGVSDHYKKIFTMVGLTQYANIYNSIEEAIAEPSDTPTHSR